MAFGLRTAASIVYISIVTTVLVLIISLEYRLLDLTVFELFRQSNRYHDYNYDEEGRPKFPKDEMKKFGEFARHRN